MIDSNDTVTARIAQDRHRLSVCDQIENLIAEARDQHPYMPLIELANLLPEAGAERLLDLMGELAITPFHSEEGIPQ